MRRPQYVNDASHTLQLDLNADNDKENMNNPDRPIPLHTNQFGADEQDPGAGGAGDRPALPSNAHFQTNDLPVPPKRGNNNQAGNNNDDDDDDLAPNVALPSSLSAYGNNIDTPRGGQGGNINSGEVEGVPMFPMNTPGSYKNDNIALPGESYGINSNINGPSTNMIENIINNRPNSQSTASSIALAKLDLKKDISRAISQEQQQQQQQGLGPGAAMPTTAFTAGHDMNLHEVL